MLALDLLFNSRANSSLKLVYPYIHTLIRLHLTVPLSNVRPEGDRGGEGLNIIFLVSTYVIELLQTSHAKD